MKIRLVDGPFVDLKVFGSLKRLPENACKIEFELHYEFSSVIGKVIGSGF